VGRLAEKLARHSLICLDTPVFIYHLEGNPDYLALTQEILAGVQAGRWRAVTSTVTVMEITVPAWGQGREGVARQYETLLANFPNLDLVDITRDVARQAARLRARFRVRPADALQVAAGLVNGATAFVTNDRPLGQLKALVEVILLEDYRS
jgi:predicted nucleic acid-binding protein